MFALCANFSEYNIIYLTKKLGEVISEIKTKKGYLTSKLAHEYDIDRGNLSRIENGLIDCKFTTAYKNAQALGLKFSDFAKILEEELGENFVLIEE